MPLHDCSHRSICITSRVAIAPFALVMRQVSFGSGYDPVSRFRSPSSTAPELSEPIATERSLVIRIEGVASRERGDRSRSRRTQRWTIDRIAI